MSPLDEGDGSNEPEMKTIRIVNSETEEKFMCEICSTMLKSSAALVRHKMSIHGSDDEKYMCSDCGISCKTRKELHNHKRKHQTFDCTKCGNTFGHGHKKRHLESCKGPEITRETIFSCDECEYQAKRKWHLNRHKKRKHSVRFLCDECGHVSSSLENFDNHKVQKHYIKYGKS